MANEKRIRLHGFVTGRVQGVGFRYFTQQTANEIGITGWVKNTYDGKVEFVAEGTEGQLKLFQRYLSRGPSSANVHDLSVDELAATEEFQSFHVRF